MKTKDKRKDWEKEFERKSDSMKDAGFDWDYEFEDMVKSFISTLLEEQKKEILDRERKMRLYGRDKEVYPENFMGMAEAKRNWKKEIKEKIEKMKVELRVFEIQFPITDSKKDEPERRKIIMFGHQQGYNQAIDDILKLL